MQIVQIHISDPIAKTAIWRVLNENHNGRIRQSSLDFYRQDYIEKLSKGWTVVFMVAFENANNPLAISLCSFGRKRMKIKHSITVVCEDERKKGIGKKILRQKINVLKDWFPDVEFKSFVNVENTASIQLCNSAGFHIVGEGIRERPDKKPTRFYIFESA